MNTLVSIPGKIFNKVYDLIINSKKYPIFYEKFIDRMLHSKKGYEQLIKKISQSDQHLSRVFELGLSPESGYSLMDRIIDGNNDVGMNNMSDREKWLEKALSEVPAGVKILDAGAGELKYKKFCTHLEYISQDFGQYDGKGNDVGFQMEKWDNSKLDIISDICEMPIENKSFDAVMCVEVFEHLPEPAKAVKEFSRVLKKDGILIITAPFCSMTHFAPYHFANGYNKYWYEKILTENGFEINEISPNGSYFEYIAQEIRRIPEMASKFSNDRLKKEEQVSLRIVLGLLFRLSKKDMGSNSLLNFGYHVRAKKIN